MFGLSTELINRKDIRVLTFRVLAECSDEGLTLKTSALECLYDLSTLLINQTFVLH